MPDKPKTFVKMLAQQVDTGWGADPENPITQEIVEEFAACDLIIEKVVRSLIATANDERNEGMLGDQGGVARVFGHGRCAPREGDMHDLRKTLIIALGGAVNKDLQVQAAINQKAAESAERAADKALAEKWQAEARVRELEAQLRNLTPYSHQ